MLFNSYDFLFIFLPITAAIFFLLGRKGKYEWAIAWLVIASLIFYGYWNPTYLGLIAVSILFNYVVGRWLAVRESGTWLTHKILLIIGIAFNLGLLGYFKYANFFVDSLNVIAGTQIHLQKIVLPLAISFFTFQQIAYLVDAYQGQTREYNFLHYCLFVTFFPQLIAGPIVHHKEMLPQFAQSRIYRMRWDNLVVGLTILSLGLFKKVVLADSLALYASPVFTDADAGHAIGPLDAWGGCLAYTLQLYFDFSGYSDMAIGIARIFGIVLPINFYAPHRALNIITFWRHWHMTLSRFLKDYVYIPLGGSRKGKYRRQLNLFITMLLGGIWHGAGWNYIIWGALHGVFLVINHGWHALRKKMGQDLSRSSVPGRVLSWLITFIAVAGALVFFRSETIPGAIRILQGMAVLNAYPIDTPSAFFDPVGLFWIVAGLLIVLVMPTTLQFMRRFEPFYGADDQFPKRHWSKLEWSPSLMWMLAMSVITVLAIIYARGYSEFLYFQF